MAWQELKHHLDRELSRKARMSRNKKKMPVKRTARLKESRAIQNKVMLMKTNYSRASAPNGSVDSATSTNESVMNILIHADGVALTDTLRQAIEKKIGRVRQYAPHAIRARLQLHKVLANSSPEQFMARVLYEIPGNDLVAEHTAHDPTVALDIVAEKIERRLRKRKTARLARRVRSFQGVH